MRDGLPKNDSAKRAHEPQSSALGDPAHRSPGAMLRVSLFQGARTRVFALYLMQVSLEMSQPTWLLRLAYFTISAVTIPIMPCGDSACGRMWQWNAHVPGLVQRTITSHRSPGAMLRVSHFHGAG